MRRIVTLALLLTALVAPGFAQTTTSACSAISLGDLGSLNGWVPSPNDAWHQDISASPVDSNSDKIMTTAGDLANRYLHPDFSNVVDGAYGIPYTVVDSTTVPLVTIAPFDSDDSDNTLYPLPTNVAIEASPGQCWTDSADHHAIVIDRTTCAAYEVYQADLCNGQWTSYANAIWDFTLGSGEKRPYGMSSVDAGGLSVFEGLIRYDEIVAGSINHAIRFTAQHTKDDNALGYFTAPAVHAAGNLWGTDNIMGMRIRLKSSFDVSGYSSTNQIILTAMKKYGMILADNGSDLFFQGTPDPRWDDNDLNALKSIPNTVFEVVQMGPVYDQYSAPTGPAPQINSFTASASTVTSGSAVVLTPNVTNGSYEFIDAVGFVRGPVTVHPTQTTTYTLWARNTYQTSTASVTVNVTPGNSTALSFVVPNQIYGASPFQVAASSNSSGTISYSVGSGPATLSGKTLTLTGTGTVSIVASQAASGSYAAATATAQFTVSSATPTLLFSPIPDQTYTSGSVQINATSNSPGAITYSVLSGPATLTGNTVAFTGAGTVTVEASQAASGGFQASSATALFTIFGASPALTFGPIANQAYGVAPFAVSAASNSSAAITYTVLSGPATLSGNTVTLTGIGAVTIQAKQAASGSYAAASALATFNVNATAPTLAFNTVSNQSFGAAPFAVSATSNSSGTITYSVSSGPATVSGNMVTLKGAGTVMLAASQAAAGSYLAGNATTSFQVSGTTPALSFAPISAQTFGVAPFAVSATSTSTGTITYSVVSGPATISGSIVTLTGSGAVTLQASQAATAGYTSTTATTSFSVAATTPTLTISPIPTQTYGAAPFAVSSSSNSAGAITYAITSGPASVSGSILTLSGVGTVTVQASQAAYGSFSAGAATATFNVTGTGTNIVFAPIASKTYGVAPFAVSATSNSPAAITYSVLTGPATIAGSVVTLNAPGSVTLQASQPAISGYSAATVNTTFAVSAVTTNLAFAPVATQTFGAAAFTVSATSNSPASITYSVVSGPATITGSTVSLTAGGLVTLQASQPASAGYAAASVTTSFSVNAADPVLVFGPIPTQAFGAAPFALSASSNSPAAINYSVVSGPATISGNLVTLTGAGSVTLQAAQIATAGYNAGSIKATFTVNPATGALSFAPVAAQTFGAAPFAVSATSNSTGPIAYAVVSGPASISGNLVSLTGVGLVTLQASQAAAGNYGAATVATAFAVNPAVSTLAFAPIATQTFGAAPFAVSVTSNSTAPVTYTVASGPAMVSGNLVSLTGAGTVTLQAFQAAAGNYAAAVANATLTVNPAANTLAFTPIPGQTFGAAPFAVSAMSNSTGAITYSIVSGPATVSGNVVSLTGAGSVTLRASQSAAIGYSAASTTTSFTVTGMNPTLTFLPVGTQTFATGPVTLVADSNSAGSITYSVVSGPAKVAGATLTMTGAGQVTVQAAQAASGGYNSGSATTSFTVNLGTPNLTLPSVATQSYGSGPITLAANSNSPGAITYAVVSGPAVASGNTVAFTGAGTVLLQVSQTATANFAAAAVAASFAVAPANPNLAIDHISTQTYGSGPLTVSATSASSAPVTFTVLSGPATITGASLVLSGAGGVTIQATQPALGNYLGATATMSFNISPSSVLLAADFAIPSGLTLTIKQGATGTINVPVSAVNGFSGIVTFQCSVPANMGLATCDTSNASLTASTTANSTVTIGTHGLETAQSRPITPAGAAFLAMLLPCGLPLFSRRKVNLRSFTLGLLLALSLAGATLTTSGCGANILSAVTPPGTYLIPVKASGGTASHATTVTVIVQPGN